MPDVNLSYLLNLKPEEIIKWFESKGNILPKDWEAIYSAAKEQAAAAIDLMKIDILQTIRDGIKKGLEEGWTSGEIIKNLEPMLDELGWYGKKKAKDLPGYDPASGVDPEKIIVITPQRLKFIYDQNASAAYNHGRYQFQMDNTATHPYLKYIQVQRPSKREAHEQYNGKVFRADDPIWDTIYPPNGYNCFPAGTPIATKEGWKPIEKINQDELILGGSGKYRLANIIFKRKFNGNLFRFATENGSAASTPNHRILTLRGWIRTENLKVGDVLVQIPEILSVDKGVGNINHSNTSRRNKRMPFPFKRKSCISNTLNSEFQFGDKNVNPVRHAIKIKNRFIANLFQMFQNNFFAFGWFKIIVGMRSRVCGKIKNFSLAHFHSDFFSSCGSILLKFLGKVCNHFAVAFCFTKARMSVSFKEFFHICTEPYGLFNPSLIGIYPLSFNGVASFSGFNSKMFHQTHNRSNIHVPASGDRINTEEFVDVEGLEGFTSGAPLDLFNSLQSFTAWASLHCITSKIISVVNIQYNGNLYNIGVDKDESYIIPIAVVHNCGCRVTAMSLSNLRQEKIPLSRGNDFDTSDIPEDWAHPPGESYQPDLSKYDKDLVAQYIKD